MTTILGYQDCSGTCWIAADSRVSDGNLILPSEGKIFQLGGWTLVHAGHAAARSALKQEWQRDGNWATADDIGVAIRRSLTAANYKTRNESGPPEFEQEWVVSDGRGIWAIYSDCEIGGPYQVSDGSQFIAMGSGWRFAMGAFFGLRAGGLIGLDEEETLKQTLLITARFDSATAAPFEIQQIPAPE